MSEENTNALLEIALAPEPKLPMCSLNLAATHGAGTSVAGLVTQAMSANLAFLRDMVDVCCGEVAEEKDFSAEKLEEHLQILFDLNALLFLTTADRIVKPARPESENVLTKAFSKLPHEDVQNYNEGILEVRAILENEVLQKMTELLARIWEEKNAYWGDDIEDLLNKRVGPKLWAIRNRVDKFCVADFNTFMNGVRNDWTNDVEQLQKCPHL